MNGSRPICNICGHTDFDPGPRRRLSSTGLPPCCRHCGSLERQRSQRTILTCLPRSLFAPRRCLQFSPDQALDPTWFKEFEVSIYGGTNSLDLEKIKRGDGTYDYISLNHVLEFVNDDIAAMTELRRILSEDGILQIGFSNPRSRIETVATGGGGPFGAFRLYGIDLDRHFATARLGMSVISVTDADPVTGAPETVHFFCRRANTCEAIHRTLEIWLKSASFL